VVTSHTDNLITAMPPGRSRRGSRRVLAIRAMIGATSWLDGRLRWHNGRVAWENGAALVVPDAAELALAQRYHYKIRRYPISADLALGDAQAWLERRRVRLELAKRLRALHAPDLPGLAARARGGDQAAVLQLVALLDVEALCLDRLPASPATTLAACGARSLAPLRALLADAAAPLSTRALAALTLGAIQMKNEELRNEKIAIENTASQFSILNSQFPWLKRAYRFGLRYGLPNDHPLILMLLADQAGFALARRYAQTRASDSPFDLPPDLLRELLARELPPTQVLALAEAGAEAGALARQILAHRPTVSERRTGKRKRKPITECSPAQRRQLVAVLAELLHGYVRVAPEAEIVARFVRLVETMLGLGQLTPEVADMIVVLLRHGLSQLPGPLLGPFLALLVEQHARLWDRSSLRPNTQQLGGWLSARWGGQIKPLIQLLGATGDITIVRDALELDIVEVLIYHAHGAPEFCRWLISVLRLFAAGQDAEEPRWYLRSQHRLASALRGLLERCKPVRSAQALLQPVVDALMAAPAARRADLLTLLLDELIYQPAAPRDVLPRLTRYLPSAVRFAARSQHPHLCWELLPGLLLLDSTYHDEAPAWFEWQLAHVLELEAQAGEGPAYFGPLGLAALFAATLADGELARFQAVFRVGLRSQFDQRGDLLERGIATLGRFPALRTALAQLFIQQPHRCAELAVRVGLATRLGPTALAPLNELESPDSAGFLIVDRHNAGHGWQALLDLAPDLAASAAAYLHAQWLLGGSFEVPNGVRRAAEQPNKLARELAYIERALAVRPTTNDQRPTENQEPKTTNDRPQTADDKLRARAANLRVYLADRERLLETTRAETRDRMAQATAEALFAAAEQQVLACYRRRLAEVAGPLPANLQLDDDLMNAALLTLDARHNRRLLRRLLRAHFTGEAGWREQHPANAAFLAKLAAQGADVGAWLSAMPRAYRCTGVNGGWVRLRLERDPVRILQMGNFFDTCLSFGGINSFSTIANACELNKRVIYATDGAGRVVGRKLIAISDDDKLVGFHTYSSLADEPARAALRGVFARYAAQFAKRCGLELADEGIVPKLFAEAWYDDGVTPWNDDSDTLAAPARSAFQDAG
jgi:hypothetical protein